MNHKKLQTFLPFAQRNKIPTMLWGPTGIGKTSGIYKYGQDVGAEVRVLHLASQEPGDLVGLPVRERMPLTEAQMLAVKKETENLKRLNLSDKLEEKMIESIIDKHSDHRTSWARPEWLPDENDERQFIFFLDEFNRAPKYVLACMFPFLLEGKLHTHKIPKNSWVCAAANPDDESGDYDVTEIHDRALISRLCHIQMVPTTEEWLIKHDGVVHEAVHKVVSKEPSNLGFSSFKLPFTIRADARASTLMGQALKNITTKEYSDFGYEFMAGCVGETMAAMVQKEWKDTLDNISPEDILKKYKKIRSSVQKFSSVENIRNDVIGGANKKLLVFIKKQGSLTADETANINQYIKDIPRDSGTSFLAQVAQGEEFSTEEVFRKLMEDLGKDDSLYDYILQANSPEEAAKSKEKKKK